MNILLTLLILGVIILIHELGHFLAAKYFKMPIREFAIGMGPKIFTYHGEETDYTLRAIPMGGFVDIEGMDIEKPVENGFNSKKPHKRFIVLFAGVFMNFVLALFIIMALTFNQGGEYKPVNKSVVGGVVEGGPADGVLQSGDKILKINDNKMTLWTDINEYTYNLDNGSVNILIDRNGQEILVPLELDYNESRKQYLIGIRAEYEFDKYTFGESIKASFVSYTNLFTGTLNGLKLLITGQVKSDEVTGPVGLVRVVDNFAKGGLKVILMLVAVLSVNIGIFNLLPVPALDGGRIIFIVLELIGVNVNKKIEERVHMVGMVVLIMLIFFITANDIKNIFMK